MTGWNYKFKCNRAEEQRGLIEGYFPVFDTGAVCSSFIYSCQSRVCKCRNKEKLWSENRVWRAEVNSSSIEQKGDDSNISGHCGKCACQRGGLLEKWEDANDVCEIKWSYKQIWRDNLSWCDIKGITELIFHLVSLNPLTHGTHNIFTVHLWQRLWEEDALLR